MCESLYLVYNDEREAAVLGRIAIQHENANPFAVAAFHG